MTTSCFKWSHVTINRWSFYKNITETKSHLGGLFNGIFVDAIPHENLLTGLQYTHRFIHVLILQLLTYFVSSFIYFSPVHWLLQKTQVKNEL